MTSRFLSEEPRNSRAVPIVISGTFVENKERKAYVEDNESIGRFRKNL